jgi:hypothetical protein
MKRASIEYKIAERDSAAMRWLRIAATLRREGQHYDARIAVRTSRLFNPPRLPDRRIPLIAAE